MKDPMVQALPGISVIVFVFLSLAATAQKVIKEFKGNLTDFVTVPSGDSVLFRYENKSTNANCTEWIMDAASTPQLLNDYVFASIRHDDKSYLYSLTSTKKKQYTVKTFIQTQGQTYLSDSIVSLPGAIVNFYTQKKSLMVITFDATAFKLTITEIEKERKTGSRSYILPINIFDYLGGVPAEVYTTNQEANLFGGLSKVKFYADSVLKLSVDQSEKHRSVVFSLNEDKVTESIFPTPDGKDLASFVLDNKLFMTSAAKGKLCLRIFDFETKEVIAKKEFLDSDTSFFVAFRYNRKNVIHNKGKSFWMFAQASLSQSMISVLKQGDKYIMEVGTNYDKDGFVGAGLATPIGLITTVAFNVARQMREGAGINRYFYCEWRVGDQVIKRREQQTALIKEQIQQFECDQYRNDVNYTYNTYTPYKDGVLATYFDRHSKTASLIFFGKLESPEVGKSEKLESQ